MDKLIIYYTFTLNGHRRFDAAVCQFSADEARWFNYQFLTEMINAQH